MRPTVTAATQSLRLAFRLKPIRSVQSCGLRSIIERLCEIYFIERWSARTGKNGRIYVEVAEAYERQRGRWSELLLAPLFVEFVGVQGEVLDVGCGTGALTFAVAKSQSVSKIVAIDVSEAFFSLCTIQDRRLTHKL